MFQVIVPVVKHKPVLLLPLPGPKTTHVLVVIRQSDTCKMVTTCAKPQTIFTNNTLLTEKEKGAQMNVLSQTFSKVLEYVIGIIGNSKLPQIVENPSLKKATTTISNSQTSPQALQ